MSKKQVFIVSSSPAYEQMFISEGWEVTDTLEEADLIQFTGGADVSPSFYGELRHPRTSAFKERDEREREVYHYAQELGIPCAGICRGGQFLNVMNLGKMFQDVDNHGRDHLATVLGMSDKIRVSSTHHQMMRPSYLEHLVLMTANESRHRAWMGKQGELEESPPSSDDVEAIYYPQSSCLCFQPHPEFNDVPECRAIYFYFINNYLLPNATVTEIRNQKEVTLCAD